MQPSIKGSDGSKNAQIQLKNPFETPKLSRFEYIWEDNTYDILPEFYGSFNLDDFVDWLNTIERVFEGYYVSEETKVKLVSKCLKGRALIWWKQLQTNKQMIGNGKIRDWKKLKKKLKEQFLPFHYLQTPYNDLHDLKQEMRSVFNSGQQIPN